MIVHVRGGDGDVSVAEIFETRRHAVFTGSHILLIRTDNELG